MSDKREEILARLLAVAAVAGIKKTYRNNYNIDESADLPAVVVTDGEENVDLNILEKNVPNTAPMLMDMEPVVTVVLQAATAAVGTALNGFRALVIPAVLEDAQLIALTGIGGPRASGAIRYLGCAPAVEEGRLLAGQLNLRFRISYLFSPDDL